jgi:hypothetical protein
MELPYEVQTSNSGGSLLYTGDRSKVSSGDALQRVPIVTLDDYKFDRSIDFISIDVEFAEPSALLEDGEYLLKKDHPLILAEINPFTLKRTSEYTTTEFIVKMQGLGYKCFNLHGA